MENLIYVGIGGWVVALHRENGMEVWRARLRSNCFVTILVEKSGILAACNGQIWCLDPLTGQLMWENGLKGCGYGGASIATLNSQANAGAQASALLYQDEAAQAASTAALVAATSTIG